MLAARLQPTPHLLRSALISKVYRSIGGVSFAATHAPFANEVERKLSNLMAHLAPAGSSSDQEGFGSTRLRIWGSEVRILPGAPGLRLVSAASFCSPFCRFCCHHV